MLRERNLWNKYSRNTIVFNMINLSAKIVQKNYNHFVFVLMCRIVGDHWDLEVKVRCQTKSQNNKSLHYFHAYAVKDRVIPKGLSNQTTTKGYWWSRDAGNFANCWGSRIHFIRPMLYNSKSNCWVFATLQNLQESSSLSYTPCTLTRDDRKVRSGKLSMHEKMFQCYSVLIKHIEGCPTDHLSKVARVGGGGLTVFCV